MRARAFVATGWLNILCQILFLGILFVAARNPIAAQGAWGAIVVTLLVLLPSALWTGFFYLRDRASPEPSHHVGAAFLFGLMAAAVFVMPVEKYLFGLQSWMYQSLPNLALAATLVHGTLVSLLIFIAIHYGFAPLDSFDEPEDGIVYGAFIGSGFAAVKSISSIQLQPPPTAFSVGASASANILVYASIGAIVGYFIGAVKFRGGAAWRPPVAVVVGALLFGTQRTLNEVVLLSGAKDAFWASFFLSAAFAIVLLFTAARLMSSVIRSHGRSPELDEHRERGARSALVVGAALLIAGVLVGIAANRPRRFSDDSLGIRFDYPAGRIERTLAQPRGEGSSPLMVPLFVANGDGPFVISISTKNESRALADMKPTSYLGVVDPLSMSTQDIVIAGHRAVRLKYSYVRPDGNRIVEFPDVRWAYADIVPVNGRTWLLSYQASPTAFHQGEAVYDAILHSLAWSDPSRSAR